MASETPSDSYEQINFLNQGTTSSSQSLRASTGQSVSSRQSVSTILCLVVLILSAVCNALLLGFIVHKQLQSESSSSHSASQLNIKDVSGALCVSCDSLNVPDPATAPFMTQVKVTKLGQRSSLCCQKYSEGLTSLINILVGQYYSYEHGYRTEDEDGWTTNTPAAHLYIDRDDIKNGRLSWDSEPGYGTAHKSGGITYNNGSIHIPRDGVYNVYSFLTLHNDVTNVDVNLVHSVNRFNPLLPNTDKLLLLNKVSMERRRGRYTTSFLSASLKLKKDDELYVEFSNPSLVYKFPPANYFGVYKL